MRVVRPVGIEPTTYGLKVRSSTAELQAHVDRLFKPVCQRFSVTP